MADEEAHDEEAERREGSAVPEWFTPLFGPVPAPETLSDLLNFTVSMTAGENSIAGWRGQSDIDWPIHSSAVRRLMSQGALPHSLAVLTDQNPDAIPFDAANPAALEYHVLQYERHLLSEARIAGHGFLNGRELNDLELLAVLQHHGAATRLLDFSRNVAVALWFASAEHPDRHGLLMAVDNSKTKHLLSRHHINTDMRSIMLGQDYPWTFTWQPQHLYERMRAQQSFFLFSSAGAGEWGSLALPDPKQDSSGLHLVAVSPRVKSELARKQQQRLFGFNGLSLFPDLEGFSRFHSAGSPYLSLQ